MTVYDFQLKQLDGTDWDWELYIGRKLLLVNVASECGLTPQYVQLQELQDAFGGPEFTVIGLPCNDFGAQEPGTSDEIAAFCSKNYGVTFPLTEKIEVLGENKHPLYAFLFEQTNVEVAWNFQKYLINKDGSVARVLSPQTNPADEEIINWINA